MRLYLKEAHTIVAMLRKLFTIILGLIGIAVPFVTPDACIDDAYDADPRQHVQRFTEVTTSVGITEDSTVQAKVRTSPNCLFPSWDDKLHLWDAGSFCMEETLTGGACVGDLDNDGFDDLYYTKLDGSDILYANRQNGSFEDVTHQANLSHSSIRSNGCAIFDMDNDGDNDIYVSTVGDVRFYLFVNNGMGEFTEEALERGLANIKFGSQMLTAGFSIDVGDIDNDGDVDIVTTEWLPWLNYKESDSRIDDLRNSNYTNNKLYLNLGSGYFKDISQAAGVESMNSDYYLKRDKAMHQHCDKVSKQGLLSMLEYLNIPYKSKKGKDIVQAFQQEMLFMQESKKIVVPPLSNSIDDLNKRKGSKEVQLGIIKFELDDDAFDENSVVTILARLLHSRSRDNETYVYVTVSEKREELLDPHSRNNDDKTKLIVLNRTIDFMGRIKFTCSNEIVWIKIAVKSDCTSCHNDIQLSYLQQSIDGANAVHRKECKRSKNVPILAKVRSTPFMIWAAGQMIKLEYSPADAYGMLQDTLKFAERVDNEKMEQMKKLQDLVTLEMKKNKELARQVQRRMEKSWNINHAAPFPLIGHFQFAAKFSDLDDDGYTDLIISGDFGSSRMFWNQQNGTFVEGFFHLVDDLYDNSMGATVGDWNLDGKLDVMFTSTSISESDFRDISLVASAAGLILKFRGNHLYQNVGNRRFEDKTDLAGVRESGWGWGAMLLDFDNDGDLDALNGNGMDDPESTDDDWAVNQKMKLYVNQGAEQNYKMKDEASLRNIDSTSENRATLTFDFDHDGDLDIFVVNHGDTPQLFRNDGGNYYDFLRVRVLNAVLTEAFGAKVRVQVHEESTDVMVHEISSSAAFLGQGERTAHFGLGLLESDYVYKVSVYWLDRNIQPQHFFNVPKRVTLVVTPATDKLGSKTFDKCKRRTKSSWAFSTRGNEDSFPNPSRSTLLQSRNKSINSLYGKKSSEIKLKAGKNAPENIAVTSNGEVADDNTENFDWLDSQI